MRLTRLYIPDQSFSAGQKFVLTPDQSHYLLRVLRMEAGQGIVLFNQLSGAWQGVLEVEGKKAIAALATQLQKPMALPRAHVLVSPLKKEAWDFMLEKATELNVASITPVTMDYTQNARINDDRARANLIEASQQCERTHVPEFHAVKKLDTLLRQWDKDKTLFVALERSDAQPALDAFQSAGSDDVFIMIGPEGGFSPRERDLFAQHEFVRPINLGTLILRAETAAITALAIFSAVK